MFERARVFVAIAGLGVLAAACSASFSIGGQTVEDAAEELITGDMADEIGIGELTAECPAVDDPEIGTTFVCTATAEDGRVITIDGIVDREDHIDLKTKNLVIPDEIEDVVFETLQEQFPEVAFSRDGVDCGDEALVVEGDSNQMSCLVEPDSAPAQTVTLTINDLETGDIDFDIEPVAGADGDQEDAAGGEQTDDGQSGLEAAAQAALLTIEDMGSAWSQSPQTESTVDYRAIEGCGPVADLVDNDGHLIEAESSSFALSDVEVEQTVRIYTDPQTAVDVIVAWGEQLTLDCSVAGAEVSASEAFASGELAPFEEIQFDLQAFQDLDGEPRFTNLQVTNTLLAPEDVQLVLINDLYLIQVGPMVSAVEIISPDTTWADTPALLDIVTGRMNAAQGLLVDS
jgi:hypothetical protein